MELGLNSGAANDVINYIIVILPLTNIIDKRWMNSLMRFSLRNYKLPIC
jgi:hypothetical protein